MESSRDPSSNVHVSLALDATEGVESWRTGAALNGDAGEGATADPKALRLLLSSELNEPRAFN